MGACFVGYLEAMPGNEALTAICRAYTQGDGGDGARLSAAVHADMSPACPRQRRTRVACRKGSKIGQRKLSAFFLDDQAGPPHTAVSRASVSARGVV